MADDSEVIQKIRENAEMAVENLRDASEMPGFGYDAASVEWVDGFIERQRVLEEATPDYVQKLTSVLGSYLGECIVQVYGGTWARSEFGWCIELPGGNAAYPFAKVHKQFTNGREGGDSVSSLFKAIASLPEIAAALKKQDS